MNKLKEVIARYLNVEANQVKSVSELCYVFCVVVRGKRATFVSKKAITLNDPTPWNWTLDSATRRQEGRKWVAKLVGGCKAYGFKREFLESESIEWGKKGVKSAVFSIAAPGFYQDSDGDYFKAWITSKNEIDCEICSKMECQHGLGLIKI